VIQKKERKKKKGGEKKESGRENCKRLIKVNTNFCVRQVRLWRDPTLWRWKVLGGGEKKKRGETVLKKG